MFSGVARKGRAMGRSLKKHLNRLLHSLQFKFFLGIDLAVVISCIILGSIMLSSQLSTELSQTLSASKSYASRATELIEAQAQSIRYHADIVTLDSEVGKIFNRDNSQMYQNINEWLSDYEKIAGQIDQSCYNSPITSVYIITDNALASRYPSENLLPLEKLRETEWYGQAVGAKSSLLFHSPSALGGMLPGKKDTICFTRNLPILYSGFETYFVGIMDKSVFNTILEPDNSLPYCCCGVLNSSGDLISAEEPDYADVMAEINAAPSMSRDFTLRETEVGGRRFYAVKAQIYNTDLVFIYLVDYEGMYLGALKDYGLKLLILLLLLIPLSMLISYALSRPLSGRMAVLRESMLKAGEGNFAPLPLTEKNDDEISLLSRRFNSMLTQLSHLMEKQYIDGKRIKELEFISLQAQINPHFLYNTLDLIKWKAIANHDRDTEELITALSNYYRLALSRGRERVPLSSEIEHIKAYVFIQNKRFDDGVTIEIDVAERYLDYQVPKLLLQPIVENAIVHGILELPDPVGTIWVRAWEDTDHLWLSICDNGVGLQDTGEAIDPEAADSVGAVVKTGYGLKNIDDRIKLAFGPEYGLELRNAENGGGVEALLRFPRPGNGG